MGMRINTNTAAMNAYRNLSVNDSAMSKSLEKLSSGFRINRAADDAAGLAISEGMKSQIGGLKVAVRNTQDGVSVVQTAEGALATTQGILQRMRDLSVQAANDGGLSADAKSNIQSEVVQLKSELTRISGSTTFNGKKLLDGSYTGTFQVGANAGETISVGIGTAMSASGLGVDGIDVTGVGTYTNAAAAAASKVSTTEAVDGTGGILTITVTSGDPTASVDPFKGLTGSINFGGKSFDLGTVDYGKAADGDNNGTTSAAEALVALNKAATAALGLTYDTTVANNPFTATATTLAFTVKQDVAGYTEAGGDPINSTAGTPTAQQLANATPTFTAASGASAGLAKLDAAIKLVSTQRANLGALQNRFEQTTANLNIAVENLTASNSRIVDVDMASEMTEFSKNQILVQAGTSMLAQANQSAQSVLKLLQ